MKTLWIRFQPHHVHHCDLRPGSAGRRPAAFGGSPNATPMFHSGKAAQTVSGGPPKTTDQRPVLPRAIAHSL